MDESGLSRQHARLVPTNTGVQVEDLGSTNGSFINGKRVQHGFAAPGDEIGFDTLRFRLTAPGQQPEPAAAAVAAASVRRGVSPWWWVAMAAAGLAAIWVAVLLR
jgi:pSer/pThr/pTyr-binding forkhead associated (FHA) protein